MEHMNWLGVVLGAVAFFAVGAVWYTVLFGKAWQAAVGLSDKQLKAGANMPAATPEALSPIRPGSHKVTSTPRRARATAQARPKAPAPATTTRGALERRVELNTAGAYTPPASI